MVRKRRPWLPLLLIASMLAALLPAAAATAAPQVRILSLYTAQKPLENGRPPADEDPYITRVTTERIDLIAEIQDMSNEQVAALYLNVTNIMTGFSETLRTIQPVRIDDFTVAFQNVPLTEGLNRVVVKLDGEQTIESPPGWVYFTPVANIVDLRINGEEFDENKFYPSNPRQSTVVNITGLAYNATEVLADLYGSSGPVNGYLSSGEFFFVGDDIDRGTPMANLRLTPGDNLITFIARNNQRSFQTTKNLIYDNGRPFAYDLIIKEDQPDAKEERLILNPTLTTNQIVLSGKLKVDVDETGTPEYPDIKIHVPGNTIEIDLIDDDLDEVVNDSPILDEFRLEPDLSRPAYRIYSFRMTFAAGAERVQTIVFEHSSASTTAVVRNAFFYYYEDPALPYIQYVEMSTGDEGRVRISEAARTEISELPVTLYVYVTPNTKSIAYQINGGAEVIVDKTDPASSYIEVEIHDLAVGNASIKFTPIDANNNENRHGARTYDFLVSSAPYVIFQNIYNGLVLTNQNMLQEIRARFVNVADIEQIRLIINGRTFDYLDDSHFDGGFETRILEFPLTVNGESLLKEGSNTVRVIIYETKARTKVAVDTTVTFFLFERQAPEFVYVEPVEQPGEDKYRETNISGTYVTNERTVKLAGQFLNVEKAEDVSLMISNVQNPPGAYFNFIEIELDNEGVFRGEFETNTFQLPESGDAIFTFSLTNGTGVVVTRTIVITREPQPYIIVHPKVRENANGDFVANVNSNFVEFEIIADHADAVLFKDGPATERKVRNPDTNLDEVRYFYEVRNLKKGQNKIRFTVVRGTEEIEAEVIINNVATPTQGAMYKTQIANRIRPFEDLLELRFPRNTMLRRNDSSAVDQFITKDRQILFGIADDYDGRVDKYKHPTAYDGQIGNPNEMITHIVSTGRIRLTRPDRFMPISPLFWIDAGTIDEREENLREALEGSGKLPYEDPIFYSRPLEDLVVPTQPGTLTLKYDPSVRRDAWKYVTVFHYDVYEDYRGITDWRWRNIGGVVDPNNNTITVPFERFGYYQVMYMNHSFDDIISHEWARDYLDIMYSKGIMRNKTNNFFIPNDPITRGEFVTLLVKIFEIPLNYKGDPTFHDVQPGIQYSNNELYDYMHIETAARAGIIRGLGGGLFHPNDSITRQDAAVMIARAANLKLNNNEQKVLSDLQKSFTDANGIDIYARPSVLAVVKAGFMEGKENVLLPGSKPTFRFDPMATFTRAEAAAVMYRVMQQHKKIPR